MVMSAACVVLGGFFVPALSHAALTSPSYTIDAPTFGNTESGTMTSVNFSLSPRVGNTYSISQNDTDVVDDQGEDHQGSKRKVTEKPNVQDIISASSNLEQRDNNLLSRSENSFVYRNNTVIEDTTLSDAEDTAEVGADASSIPAPVQKKLSLLANLISADVDEIIKKIQEKYAELFAHFPARVVTALWIFLILYYLRFYTKIGKKYAPF